MMNMGDDMQPNSIIEQRIRNKRKILFEASDDCLKPLDEALKNASHKVNILFAFRCLEDLWMVLKEKSVDVELLSHALRDAKSWASGDLKMPVVKKQILEIHHDAKQQSDKAIEAYLHAFAQGLSVIHTKKHVMGLPIYALTGYVRDLEPSPYSDVIEEKIKGFIGYLFSIDPSNQTQKWASFIK
jgi:hypothetical protein